MEARPCSHLPRPEIRLGTEVMVFAKWPKFLSHSRRLSWRRRSFHILNFGRRFCTFPLLRLGPNFAHVFFEAFPGENIFVFLNFEKLADFWHLKAPQVYLENYRCRNPTRVTNTLLTCQGYKHFAVRLRQPNLASSFLTIFPRVVFWKIPKKSIPLPGKILRKPVKN